MMPRACWTAGVATTAQIDVVACAVFDLPLGPFAVMNIVKPRIALYLVENIACLGAFYAPAAALIEAGKTRDAWDIDDAPAALFLPVLEAIGEGVSAPNDFDLGALGRCGTEEVIAPLIARYGAEMPRLGLDKIF